MKHQNSIDMYEICRFQTENIIKQLVAIWSDFLIMDQEYKLVGDSVLAKIIIICKCFL